jgi:hypothetical protein
MAPSAPTSPLREILEGRLSQILVELEGLFDARLATQVTMEVEQRLATAVANVSVHVRERARSEFAEELNQAARRIRQATDVDELIATLLDTTGAYATGIALFRVSKSIAKGERIRGVPDQQAEEFRGLEIPLASAAALGEAVQSGEPVASVTSTAEVSAALARIAGHSEDGRAFVYPLVARERVPALVYAWGTVQGVVLEMLTQFAAAVWAGIPAPVEPVSLTASPGSAPTPWEKLAASEQQLHLRAQRFARVQVAEMRLFETDAVQTGRARRDLYGALRVRIDGARDSFRKSFFISSCPSMVDYLHLELVRTLANDDPEVLGKDYPGPLV